MGHVTLPKPTHPRRVTRVRITVTPSWAYPHESPGPLRGDMSYWVAFKMISGNRFETSNLGVAIWGRFKGYCVMGVGRVGGGLSLFLLQTGPGWDRLTWRCPQEPLGPVTSLARGATVTPIPITNKMTVPSLGPNDFRGTCDRVTV